MSDHAKSVIAGKLLYISPTLLDTFDESQQYGCERKGFFRYVKGLKEPKTDKQELGTLIHKMNEVLLRENKHFGSTEQATRIWRSGVPFLEGLRQGLIVGVEAPVVGYQVDGVPVHPASKCDLVHENLWPSVWDWKTTGNIEKKAKTPGQLARNNQMVLYAKAFWPDSPEVELGHGYYQTEGTPRFQPVSVTVSQQRLDDHIGSVTVPLVQRIKQAVVAQDVVDVKPRSHNQSDFACRYCAFKQHCPSAVENPIMSLFKKYDPKKPLVIEATPTAPEPIRVVEGPLPNPTPAILPPDAPASDPKLAAEPVAEWSDPAALTMDEDASPGPASVVAPIPAPASVTPETVAVVAGKKRGRPAKAKTELDATAPAPMQPGCMAYESFTVSYGVTVNLGNFNSVRFDESVTVKTNEPDSVRAKVFADMKSRVDALALEALQGSRVGAK